LTAPDRLKALMVDVDGVIVTPRLGGWAADLERDLGVAPQALAERFFARHWDDVALGRAGLHERLAPVLAEIAPGVSSERLAAYWFSKDSVLDYQLLDDLALMRARGLSLHLATVQEHCRAAHLWTRLGLREQFDAMHYAADLGCAKPDPAFFAAIGARTGYAPDEMLLIDDRADNVEAARAAGWAAVIWTGEIRLPDLLAHKPGAA
jgi:putative hydrolase of the HAD superfamily